MALKNRVIVQGGSRSLCATLTTECEAARRGTVFKAHLYRTNGVSGSSKQDPAAATLNLPSMIVHRYK